MLKSFKLQGEVGWASPLPPDQGLCPWTLLGAQSPDQIPIRWDYLTQIIFPVLQLICLCYITSKIMTLKMFHIRLSDYLPYLSTVLTCNYTA